MRNAVVVGLGILVLLSASGSLASEDGTPEQSDADQPNEQSESEGTESEDIGGFPPPDFPLMDELGEMPMSMPFRGPGGRGPRGDSTFPAFGLGRGPGSVPLRASLQLGGYYANYLRYMSSSASLDWNKRKFSWRNSVTYQIDWSQQQFRTSSRDEVSKLTDGMIPGTGFTDGITPNPEDFPSDSTAGSQPVVEIGSGEDQRLELETRLDYSLSKLFLFELGSLRLDTSSLDRAFIGAGMGRDLPKNVKLDLGIGLTRFFGEYETADSFGRLLIRSREEESETLGTEATLFSTLEWRSRPLPRTTMDFKGRVYWYVQERQAGSELDVGTNFQIIRGTFLRLSTSLEYLPVEQSGDPFQYRIQASLVYQFMPSPRRPEQQ